MGKAWVPLESNPLVLTDYIVNIGVKDEAYAFYDVFGLTEDLLVIVPQPVLAVIMCFPVTAISSEAPADAVVPTDPTLFYMKQTVGNACGTIAVLHSLGNNKGKINAAPGSFLEKFLSSTATMSPEERGRYLEDPPAGGPNIEEAHQVAAAGGNTAPPSADEDVDLHFVAFVNHNGTLLELDGRRDGPVAHGPTSEATLLQDTAKVVEKLVARTDNLSFNLMALAEHRDFGI